MPVIRERLVNGDKNVRLPANPFSHVTTTGGRQIRGEIDQDQCGNPHRVPSGVCEADTSSEGMTHEDGTFPCECIKDSDHIRRERFELVISIPTPVGVSEAAHVDRHHLPIL